MLAFKFFTFFLFVLFSSSVLSSSEVYPGLGLNAPYYPEVNATYAPWDRHRCVFQDGDYSGWLKSFPPGAYAWGEFLPYRYTTWGYLNIASLLDLSTPRPSKYNDNFTLGTNGVSERQKRNLICPTPPPTPHPTRPVPEPTPYPAPVPTPQVVSPTPAPRTRPPAPGPTPQPPTPSSPGHVSRPPAEVFPTLPPPPLPQYAKNPFFPDLNWTIEFWVLLNDYPSKLYSFISQHTVDGGEDRNSVFFIGSTSVGHILFFMGSGQEYYYLNLQTENHMELLKWYHVVVTVDSLFHGQSTVGSYDEKYAAIWVNGQLWGRTAFTTPTLIVSSLPIQVGRYKNNVTTFRCNCFLDEIRFWGRCQKLETLYSRANKLLSGAEPHLVGYWNFEDDTELNIPDGSPSDNPAIQRGSSGPYLTPVAEIGRGCDSKAYSGNYVRQFGNARCVSYRV